MAKQRWVIVIASLFALMFLWWQATKAKQTPAPSTHPAQMQVRQLQQTLLDSEAESVLGAYIPGVGVVINMELVRGPNSATDKTATDGVRDWLIYLMTTFGTQLTAVPTNEKIIFSVDFYDYTWNTRQQMVMESTASTTAAPETYGIWLNGDIYGTTDSEPVIPKNAMETDEPMVAQENPATTPLEKDNESVATHTQPDWYAVAGEWEPTDSGYRQKEIGRFDLVNFQSTPITAETYTITVDMLFEQGDMGGGLVFNAPSLDGTQSAQMVSYTAEGTYLQWGYYDESGIHQFQAGSPLSSPGNDGQWHQLTIKVSNGSYSIHLDGIELGSDFPLYAKNGQFAGLMVSQSQVLFSNYNVQTLENTE